MYELIRTTDEFLGLVQLLELYIKQPDARLAVDLETCGGRNGEVPRATINRDGTYNGYIRTIQIGLDPTNPKLAIRDKQYIIDCKRIPLSIISEKLKPILEGTRIVGQNLKYDWQFLFMHLGIRMRQMTDLMLMSQVLYAGDKIQHGLGHLYGRFLHPGWFFDKTGMSFDQYQEHKKKLQTIDWDLDDDLDETQLKYAADDVELPFYVRQALIEEIDRWREDFEPNYPSDRGIRAVLSLEFNLIPIFAMMELRGIKLDTRYHYLQVIKYLEHKRDEAAAQVGFTRVVRVKKSNGLRGKKRITWEEDEVQPLNLRSWQQLKPRINELLREHLGPGIEIDSTAEDDIKDIVNRYSIPDENDPERPVLAGEVKEKLLWILQYKKATSLLSKFGQKMVELACEKCAENFDPHCSEFHRLHPNWFQIGTDELAVDSGRSSCSKPNIMQQPSRGYLWVRRYDSKGNPITYDKSGDMQDGIAVLSFFRNSFVAEDGWIFLDADYSQEEPRIAAEICNEKYLIEQYKTHGKKTDIHGIVAQALMGLTRQPLKNDPDERMRFYRDYIGKTAGLSLIYGISYKSLSEFMYSKTDGKVVWKEEDAKAAYDAFFAKFPNIRRAMDAVRRDVEDLPQTCGHSLAPFKKNRRPFAKAETLLGRHRRFVLADKQWRMPDHELSRNFRPPKIDPETKQPVLDDKGNVVLTNWNSYKERVSLAAREAFNHKIQGTSADILKIASIAIEKEFEEAGFDWREGIVAVIHDEILAHVKAEHKEQAAEIIERNMKAAFARFIKQVPCETDLNSGKSWGEAKLGY